MTFWNWIKMSLFLDITLLIFMFYSVYKFSKLNKIISKLKDKTN